MRVVPVTLAAARTFVAAHHRHNKPPQGHRYSIGLIATDLFDEDELVGVCVIGRPIARRLDDGVTAEITRLCVLGHAPLGACSKLYRAAWRAWREMGGKRMITYTLQTESGASLKGAGFSLDAKLSGAKNCAWLNRSGRDDQAIVREPKNRWVLQ